VNIELLFSQFEESRDSPNAQCDALQQIAELHLTAGHNIMI
jgi:hypothetical protein